MQNNNRKQKMEKYTNHNCLVSSMDDQLAMVLVSSHPSPPQKWYRSVALQRGLLAQQYLQNVHRKKIEINFVRRAFCLCCLINIPPRATFTNTQFDFILANAARLNIPLVSAVSGQATTTKSLRRNSSSSDTYSAPNA